jgi:hypothetical protein
VLDDVARSDSASELIFTTEITEHTEEGHREGATGATWITARGNRGERGGQRNCGYSLVGDGFLEYAW